MFLVEEKRLQGGRGEHSGGFVFVVVIGALFNGEGLVKAVLLVGCFELEEFTKVRDDDGTQRNEGNS